MRARGRGLSFFATKHNFSDLGDSCPNPTAREKISGSFSSLSSYPVRYTLHRHFIDSIRFTLEEKKTQRERLNECLRHLNSLCAAKNKII